MSLFWLRSERVYIVPYGMDDSIVLVSYGWRRQLVAGPEAYRQEGRLIGPQGYAPSDSLPARPHLLKIPQDSTAEPLVRDLVFKRARLWESKRANPQHILISFASFLSLTRSFPPSPWILPLLNGA